MALGEHNVEVRSPDVEAITPEVRDQPSSAPTSEQAEDFDHDDRSPMDVSNEPDMEGGPDDQARLEVGMSDAATLGARVENTIIIESSSEEAPASDQESGSSVSSSSESETECTAESGNVEVPSLVDEKGKGIAFESDSPSQNRGRSRSSADQVGDALSIGVTDGYSSTGVGDLDIPIRPEVGVPRILSWVSPSITQASSIFRAGDDLSHIVNKISIRGRLWNVEGMKLGEHAASWPGSLRFVMYDVVISEMHIIPPFTKLQQSVLARLNLSPSQLHPNGWAFLRAFEQLCLALRRPVSVDLFFHLFEINRNSGTPTEDCQAWEYVSLRSLRGCKIFRAFADSLKGDWKERFYYVEPVNRKAIDCVGKFSPDGSVLESTKFPIGWGLGHYNKSPRDYRVDEKRLTRTDLVTKYLLEDIAAMVPFTKYKYRGIPADRMVRCATKSKTQAVLGRIGSCLIDFEVVRVISLKLIVLTSSFKKADLIN